MTVLDFIGQQRREFRFDGRLQALTGIPARKLPDAIKHDFPYLPSGCYVHLDRVASDIVLKNINESIRTRRDQLVRELRDLGDVSLLDFLRGTGRSLREVYTGSRAGWMNLRRDAGLPAPPELPDDRLLIAAVGRMAHVDDGERLEKYRDWLVSDVPPDTSGLSVRDTRLLNMLHLDLWSRGEPCTSLADSLNRLWDHEGVRLELVDVLHVLADEAQSLVVEDSTSLEPLAIHAHHTRDEVLAALGVATPERPPTVREGVVWAKDANTDAFFVTLRKSDKRFSTTTMYRDYALSPWEFHWESQSTTSVRSATGQRYINHLQRGSRVLLFARDIPEERSFLCLGPAHYQHHTGDRPITITWRLQWEIPPLFFLQARAAG